MFYSFALLLSALTWIVWCSFISFLKPFDMQSYFFYYAALLLKEGPHIASHSVCLSVRLSVRPSRASRSGASLGATWRITMTHWGPHNVRPSRPHKLVFHLGATYGDRQGIIRLVHGVTASTVCTAWWWTCLGVQPCPPMSLQYVYCVIGSLPSISPLLSAAEMTSE